jgi:hypothetical protein
MPACILCVCVRVCVCVCVCVGGVLLDGTDTDAEAWK